MHFLEMELNSNNNNSFNYEIIIYRAKLLMNQDLKVKHWKK